MAAVFLKSRYPNAATDRLSGAGRSLGVVQGTTVVVRVPDRSRGRRMKQARSNPARFGRNACL